MKTSVNKKRLYVVYLPILVIMASVGFAATIGPVDLWVAVNTGNTAPVIYNVTPVTVTPVAGTDTEVEILFNVSDADGTGNLDDSSVAMNLSLIGYADRTNDTGNCEVVESTFNGGTDRTYRCTVVLKYHDNASAFWVINISAADSAGSIARNNSENITVNSVSGFSLVSDALALSASLGSSDNQLSFTLNNTGNFDFSVVNVTPYNLNASITDIFVLSGNFSLNGTLSGSGFGVNLANASGVNISEEGNSNLSIQLNKSNADGSGGHHASYIYIDIPNDKGLSSGVTYNSSYAWDVWAS